MTTIAYKHPYIASDSRCSAGNVIITDNENKHCHVDGWDSFIAGRACDSVDFSINLMKVASDLVYECAAISSAPDGDVYHVTQSEDGYYCRYKVESGNVYAIGSGADFALAAMDLGKTAKEAVEYAMTRDVYTGGKVVVFNVESGEFEV